MTTIEFAGAILDAGWSLYTAAGVSVDAMRAAQNDLYRLALVVMARTTDTLDTEFGWLIESIWVDHCLDKAVA